MNGESGYAKTSSERVCVTLLFAVRRVVPAANAYEPFAAFRSRCLKDG